MNNRIFIISFVVLILVFVNCDSSLNNKKTIKVSIEKNNSENPKGLMNDLISELDSSDDNNVGLGNSINDNQDCIFDQTTQTDEFLNGVKELSDYEWFPEKKEAEVVLNDHWSLTIKRGGCDHFEMSATFFYDRILDIEKDKKQIFDSIIWITSLLEEFDGESIKKAILDNKITIS